MCRCLAVSAVDMETRAHVKVVESVARVVTQRQPVELCEPRMRQQMFCTMNRSTYWAIGKGRVHSRQRPTCSSSYYYYYYFLSSYLLPHFAL